MKNYLLPLAVVLSTTLGGMAYAASHAGAPMATASAPAAKPAVSEMAEAEVRKVDKDAKKVTLKHGAIKNLDMPPMTMVFTAKDPAMLERVAVGDKVRFAVADEGGKMLVTDIQPAK